LKAQLLEGRLKQLRASLPPDLKGMKPTDKVEIDVPLAPDGSVHTINDKPYFGRKVVEFQTAMQIMSMVSESHRAERERLMERKGPMDGTLIHGSELVKMRRYQEIMGDSNG
jgi:hypothetical protein